MFQQSNTGFWINLTGSLVLVVVAECRILLITDGSQRELVADFAHHRHWTVRRTLVASGSDVGRQLDELRLVLRRREVEEVVVDAVQLHGMSTTQIPRELATFARLERELGPLQEPWLESTGGQGQLLQIACRGTRTGAESQDRGGVEPVARAGRQLGRFRAVVPTAQVFGGRAASLQQIAQDAGLGVSIVQRFLAVQRQGDRYGT